MTETRKGVRMSVYKGPLCCNYVSFSDLSPLFKKPLFKLLITFFKTEPVGT